MNKPPDYGFFWSKIDGKAAIIECRKESDKWVSSEVVYAVHLPSRFGRDKLEIVAKYLRSKGIKEVKEKEVSRNGERACS